ncbi:MAG: hypothetical protein ACI9TY_000451 [Alphaproteobacteria bacterium]|jgi:hypothetical protein
MNLIINLPAYEIDPGTFVVRLPVKHDDQSGHVYLVCAEVVSDIMKSFEDSQIFINMRIVDFYYTGMQKWGPLTSMCYHQFGETIDNLYNHAVNTHARQLTTTIISDELWKYYDEVEQEAPEVFQPKSSNLLDDPEDNPDSNIFDMTFDKDDKKK